MGILDIDMSGTLPKIAILGSCVTRDAFGKTGEAFGYDIVFCLMRQTLLASTSAPTPVAEPGYRGLTRFERRCLDANLEKGVFDGLAAAVTEWLIVDLIDERFEPAQARSGALIARALGFAENSDVLGDEEAGFLRVPWNWAAVERASLIAASEWVRRLTAAAPEDRIVIHRAFWSDRVFAGEADHPADEATARRAAEHNARLARLYDRLQALMPRAHVIEIDKALRIADPAHRWGPAPFHYVGGYYRAFLAELGRVIRPTRLLSRHAMIVPPAQEDWRLTAELSASCASVEQPLRAFLDIEHVNPAIPRPTPALDAEAMKRDLLIRIEAGDLVLAARLGRALLADGFWRADPVLGFELCGVAALFGDAEAALDLGRCLVWGIGVNADPDAGIAWIKRARERGVARAEEVLADLHCEGRRLPKRPDLARIYYRRAAEAGSVRAARRLSALYQVGEGGDPCAERAAYWLKRARAAHADRDAPPSAAPAEMGA